MLQTVHSSRYFRVVIPKCFKVLGAESHYSYEVFYYSYSCTLADSILVYYSFLWFLMHLEIFGKEKGVFCFFFYYNYYIFFFIWSSLLVLLIFIMWTSTLENIYLRSNLKSLCSTEERAMMQCWWYKNSSFWLLCVCLLFIGKSKWVFLVFKALTRKFLVVFKPWGVWQFNAYP